MIGENKFSQWLLVVIFIALIIAPVAALRWTGGETSTSENRIFAKLPVIFLVNGKLNPNFGGESKQWLEDHIGFRNGFIKLSTAVKTFFRQPVLTHVHVGEEGWLFYTLNENLQIATGGYNLTEDILEQSLVNHLAIRDKLAKKGIEYIVVFPPSKVSVYPEYMRYGDGKIRTTPVDIVADYLENCSDLKIIRLKGCLLEAKKTWRVFYKTDTHWSHTGTYAAYREIIEKMNEWGLCDTKPVDVSFEQTEYRGDLSNMLAGAGIETPSEITLSSRILNPKAIFSPSTEKAKRFLELAEEEGISSSCNYYANPAAQVPSVMVFGDSFFSRGGNIQQLLAENFSEFFYIWTGADIRESLVDEMRPDIVINELTERMLNTFPARNHSFLSR
ncbi:MAG: hypothetical protein IJU98_05795 [Synergistaceae bacterium]|nr:hypothetical protein [Synergistaceae bacterium]